MKVKQDILPFSYSSDGEYLEINGVQFSHYCPNCNICLDYKMEHFFDLKYCFNCGKKLDLSGVILTPKPIRTIKIKLSDVINGKNRTDVYKDMVESINRTDLTEDLSIYL